MFLLQSDFKGQIQDQTLAIAIQGDSSLLNSAERTAIAEMTSYLTARYDCDKEFADIFEYNNFDNYAVGQRVLHNGLLYVPASEITQVPPGNEPPPIYTDTSNYAVGDHVLVMPSGKQYTCTAASTNNTPPDSAYWTAATIQYWLQKDTRNPLLRTYCIDIALYHLHSRINPRQVPELRQTRYSQATSWLKEISAQKINPQLTPYTPIGVGDNDTTHDYVLFGGNLPRKLHF